MGSKLPPVVSEEPGEARLRRRGQLIVAVLLVLHGAWHVPVPYLSRRLPTRHSALAHLLTSSVWRLNDAGTNGHQATTAEEAPPTTPATRTKRTGVAQVVATRAIGAGGPPVGRRTPTESPAGYHGHRPRRRKTSQLLQRQRWQKQELRLKLAPTLPKRGANSSR